MLAVGTGLTLTVAMLTSSIQGAAPITLYSKVEVGVTPGPGVNVPAPALKVPPVPLVLVQVPPDCSPVIKFPNVIRAKLLAQIVVAPSLPAVGCGFTVTVTMVSSLAQGGVPATVYLNVEVPDAPADGV